MSTSTDITIYEPADIKVCESKDVPEVYSSSAVDVRSCNDTDVTVHKKEYTIVSDGLYIPKNTDITPPWLDDLINDATANEVGGYITDIIIADGNLLDALDALTVANNAYKEMVSIDVRVDQAMASVLTTLNSRLDASDATIINLSTTRVTADQASAISLHTISSSLNDGSPNSIGGRFVNVNSSITTLAGNVTKTRDLLESRYGELNEAIADLEIEVGAAIDEVYSSFRYDSILRIGDEKFRSGFGLNSSVKVPIPGEPGVYRSEFWIDAQRFMFTNSNQTGAVSPFTIDASGSNPQISFNGVVSFSNIAGPGKPEDNATRNENRGPWTTYTPYFKGDIVSSDGNSWVAKTNHMSNSSNKPPSTSAGSSTTWDLFAAKGDQGVHGLTVTTVQVYKRSAWGLFDSDKPSTNSTYTFSTAAITGLNKGWSTTIPAGDDPLYVTVASVDSVHTADTAIIPANRWSTPVKYVENGLNVATVFLFTRTASTVAPPVPTNSIEYSFITQSITKAPNNFWSEDVPSGGGRYRWITKATAASTGHKDIINSSEWSTPRIIAEDGSDGADGADGAAGADGASGAAVTVIYKRTTNATAPAPGYNNPPSGWSSTVPPDNGLPAWESIGKHEGDGWWVWETPSVSATYWTKPDSTRIDGNKIFTGEAYVDTLEIKGHSITINEYAEVRGELFLKANDPWTPVITKKIAHPGYNAGAVGMIILVNYKCIGIGPTDVDCRVIRSGWISDLHKVSVLQDYYNSYTLAFYDPHPTTDPDYTVQFRIDDLSGSYNDDGKIADLQAVFISGKR